MGRHSHEPPSHALAATISRTRPVSSRTARVLACGVSSLRIVAKWSSPRTDDTCSYSSRNRPPRLARRLQMPVSQLALRQKRVGVDAALPFVGRLDLDALPQGVDAAGQIVLLHQHVLCSHLDRRHMVLLARSAPLFRRPVCKSCPGP